MAHDKENWLIDTDIEIEIEIESAATFALPFKYPFTWPFLLTHPQIYIFNYLSIFLTLFLQFLPLFFGSPKQHIKLKGWKFTTIFQFLTYKYNIINQKW